MSNDRARLLSLAKVLIAAAWADGEITNDEKNCLKDTIYHLTGVGMQLTAREWEMLEMYIEAPIGDEERVRLVRGLQDAIQTREERQFVLNALQEMALADGISGEQEQQVINEVAEAVQQADIGFLDGLNRLLGRTLNHRSAAVAKAPNREAFFDDYLKNKVYYETSRQLSEEGRSLDLSDSDLRKLGLAGGLMARIALVDNEISEDEFEAMVSIISDAWLVDHDAAIFVANVAMSSLDATYDFHRMTREFATSTTLEERKRFMVALFLIAAANDGVSFEETEEIRLVSRGINLTHEDFIEAKTLAKQAQT